MSKAKQNDDVFTIYVEGDTSEINYHKILNKLINEKLADKVVVAFMGKDDEVLLGEIKTIKNVRYLIINENSSPNLRVSAAKQLHSIKEKEDFLLAVEKKRPIKILAAY